MTKQTSKAAADSAPKRGRGRPKKVVPSNVNPEAVAGCYAEYSGMMGDIARLGQRIAACFGRYEKSDGVDSKAIKHAYGLSQKDPAVAAAQTARNNEYLRLLGIVAFDASGQGDFSAGLEGAHPIATLAPEAAAKVHAARAHADGYNSGLAGGTLEHNQHPTGSEAHVRWIEGYHDGHADRLLKNPDVINIKQASPRKARREPEPEMVLSLAADITAEMASSEAH